MLDEFIPELREAGFRIGVVVDEAHHSFTKATETVNFYRDMMRPEFILLTTGVLPSLHRRADEQYWLSNGDSG